MGFTVLRSFRKLERGRIMTITYIRIPVELLVLKLERTQLMILALALAFGNTGLKLSNNELSRIFKVKRRNIIRAINGLREDGHLNRDPVSNHNRRLIVSDKITRLVVAQPSPLADEGSGADDTTDSGAVDTKGSGAADTKIVAQASPITEEQKVKQKNKHKGERAPSRFLKPSIQEVTDYAESIGYDSLNSQSFVDYYESNGWRVEKNPMRDWRATVRTWKERERKDNRYGKEHTNNKRDFSYAGSDSGETITV